MNKHINHPCIMKTQQIKKYVVAFHVLPHLQDSVSRFLPMWGKFDHCWYEHPVYCDSEELAIEYVKKLCEEIISARVSVDGYIIDMVINAESKEFNDFQTKDEFLGTYRFTLKSENGLSVLMFIDIKPRWCTIVTD